MPRKDASTRRMNMGFTDDLLTGREESSTTRGLERGFKRTTMLVHEGRLNTIKAWAAIQGRPYKDVLDEAMQDYISAKIPADVLEVIERHGANE